jgi:hypothetical protein
MAIMEVACPPEQYTSRQTPRVNLIVDDDKVIGKGEVFEVEDCILFAFTEADPDYPPDAEYRMSIVMSEHASLVNSVVSAEMVLISECETGTGGVAIPQWARVYWNMSTNEPAATKTADTLYVGVALEEKTANTAEFLIRFDGTDPSRGS